MPIERHQIINREQWLALRKDDVTASRVAALFGQHPYVSALRLYLEHSGVDFPDPDSNVMRRGRWFESAVGVAVAEDRPDWKIVKATEYLRDSDLRLGATPDFFVESSAGIGVLQTKTSAPSVYERDWQGGKEVPRWITLQCLTECMLADAAFGVVAVLLVDAFNPTVSIVDVPRHEGAEARIKLAVAKFWEDVREGREPAADYGKDADIIKVLAPREAAADAAVDLSGSNELPTLLAERARKKALIAELDDRCKEIETELKFAMRDAAVVIGLDDWKITWKTQHYDEKLMPARDTRVLRIYDKRKEFGMTDTAVAARKPTQVLHDQLSARTEQFRLALPKHIPVERFFRVIGNAVNINPDLLACDRPSLFNAAMRCAQDGLLPDGREAALVPFKSKVSYLPMYQGLLKKFRNSGQFKWLTAGIVYEGEEYEHWISETGEHFKHIPGDDIAGKKIRRVYALATTKDGGSFIADMPLSEINKRRAMSRGSRDDAPWKLWESEMQKKTAIRVLSKLLPMSSDLDDLIRKDEELYDLDEESEPARAADERRVAGTQAMLDHFAGEDKDGDEDDEHLTKVAGTDGTGDESDLVEETEQEQPGTNTAQLFVDPIVAAEQRGHADRVAGQQRRAVPGEYREKPALAAARLKGWDAKRGTQAAKQKVAPQPVRSNEGDRGGGM